MKGNLATLLGDHSAAVAAIRPHYLPFIRNLSPITLETSRQEMPFSVSAKPESKELSLSVTGNTLAVPATLWEGYLGRYIETNGSTDISLYRDCGPFGSYMVLITDLFFQHLRSVGPCECFGSSNQQERRVARLQRQQIQPDRGV